MRFERVLAIAPHTDDVELGAGGTVARLAEEGASVHVVAFSTAEQSLPAECPPDLLEREFRRAMPILGVPEENLIVHYYPVRRLAEHRQEVLDEMMRLRRALDPDLVLLPSGSDVHQDHQVTHAEGLRAFRDLSVLGYELTWNHVSFAAQAFVALQQRHIDLKWQALQVYESQFDLSRPYFSREFVESLARVRGTQVKTEYAEAFEVIRMRF